MEVSIRGAGRIWSTAMDTVASCPALSLVKRFQAPDPQTLNSLVRPRTVLGRRDPDGSNASDAWFFLP